MSLRDMFVPRVQFEAMKQERDELKAITLNQNKLIVALKEENRQQDKLISFYEACINQGVKIDFPDVTGGGKEDNDISGDIDFSDF